ncbi:phospholipase D-like domain-containing protein [Paenibacillus albus]|uniref:phospholipase D n=1 Tax=Paenibacillus albus TaxID=2495582 RepID=A0A3Q8X4M1_9BACL|nr:phospholipase D-like domain-containing protein [Paenibacillus albus]AZN40387.1 hypothetical protein EJC50_12560 [Paenibacillus albus]
MKRTSSFLTSAMILIIALTVFVVPLLLFILLSLFTLIVIGYHEFQQQKKKPNGSSIWGAVAITLLLSALTVVLTEHLQLQMFFGVLSLFWIINVSIFVLSKFPKSEKVKDGLVVPTDASATAGYEVLNTKIDALAAMLVHMSNQQTATAQQNHNNSNDIINVLIRMSDTLTDLQNTKDNVSTISGDWISEKLNTVLQDFQSKIETYINNTLETMRFTDASETQAIMDQLHHVSNTIQAIDSTQAGHLQALTEALQLHDEAIREQLSQGNDAVEIISSSSEIKDAILKNIVKADTYIDICVFSFTERSVLNELLKKEIPIRMIIDGPALANSVTGSGSGKLRPETVKLLRTLKNKKNVIIKSFNAVNGQGHMHRKEMIIDSKFTLSGSANYSKNAFENSIERLYIFKGHDYSKKHQLDFDLLWKDLFVDALLYV